MFRADKMNGHLVSVTLSADTVNGTVVGLGALSAEGEAFATTALATGVPKVVLDPIVFDRVYNLVSPEVTALSGETVRGRYLVAGDIFTIKQSQITGYVDVNDVVEISANGWEVGGTALDTFKARVIAEETIEGLDCAVIEVFLA